MKKSLFILIFCIPFHFANAQDSLKIKDIEKLLEITNSAKIGIQMGEMIVDRLKGSFSNVPEEHWEKFEEEMYEEESIIELIAPVYAKYYTHEDIKAMIAFYESPVGQKIIDVTPELMQESMEVGQEWGQKIAEKIIYELEHQGYTQM